MSMPVRMCVHLQAMTGLLSSPKPHEKIVHASRLIAQVFRRCQHSHSLVSMLCYSLLSRSQRDVNRLNLRSGNGSVLPAPGYPASTRSVSAGRDGTQVPRQTPNGIPVRTRKRYPDIGDVVGICGGTYSYEYVSSFFFSRLSVSL